MNILLINTNPVETQDIAAMLNGCTFRVTTVDSTDKALSLIQLNKWDLLILDISWLTSDSVNVNQIIKNLQSGTKLLVISSSNSVNEWVMTALRGHEYFVLTKPVDREILFHRIEQLGLQMHWERRKRRRVALAIGAHPDDVEIGCGGTLLMRSLAGDECHILTLTKGEEGGNRSSRMQEAYKAAELLGAELHFGDLSDTRVTEGTETIKLIESYINTLRPDTVYTHSTKDLHQDHRNCSRASMVAARNVRELFCYQSPSSDISFSPARFINITDFFDKKVQAIHCFTSQKNIRPYLEDSMIHSTAEYWGRFASYNLVEPFEVMRCG